MQVVNSHGEKVWSEEMVSYSYYAERKDRKTVQREVAQSSEARHQGTDPCKMILFFIG